MIIDAKDLLLGRLSTLAAKKALEGEAVNIVNCEKAIISGDKKKILKKHKQKFDRGTHTTGPFIPKIPERFVKRSIRGMLPYKKPRGREAFERIKCFHGLPEKFEKEKLEKPSNADFTKLNTLKYLTVGEICKFLGDKR